MYRSRKKREGAHATGLSNRPLKRKVAVFLNLLTHFTRTVATGFARYAGEKGNWSIVVAHEATNFQVVLGDDDFGTLDGILTGYAWENLPRVNCPIVYAHTPDQPPTAPTVCPDNFAVGQLAADHLFSLGLPYFSFVGVAPNAFSTERQQGFERGLAAHRRRLQQPLLFPTWRDMTHGSERLREWLSKLLLPCAVFCADDRMASALANAARAAGIQVPESMAILGVNDDDLACIAAIPPLSSISVNGDKVGYEAARQLDRCMLDPAAAKPSLTRIPPGEIVERGSTQVMGYDDLTVCEAMRLIRTRAAHEPVMVDHIAAELRVHRQHLNRSFAASVGHSPKEELDRVRADRLRALLVGAVMPVKQIAYEMGFTSASELIRFCRRVFGQTPLDIRKAATQR